VGAAVVSGLPDHLPRSRRHTVGPRCHGRSHDPVPVGAGLRRRTGTARPASPAAMHRVLAGGRDHHQGQGGLDLPISRRDSLGQTINFLLSARRDAAAAKRFLRRALAQPHTVNPGTTTCCSRHEASWPTVALLSAATVQIPEQHCRAGSSQDQTAGAAGTRLRRSWSRFRSRSDWNTGGGSLSTARRTLAGYEVMPMIRKGQVHNTGGRDMQAQTAFVAGLFARYCRLKSSAIDRHYVPAQGLQQNPLAHSFP